MPLASWKDLSFVPGEKATTRTKGQKVWRAKGGGKGSRGKRRVCRRSQVLPQRKGGRGRSLGNRGKTRREKHRRRGRRRHGCEYQRKGKKKGLGGGSEREGIVGEKYGPVRRSQRPLLLRGKETRSGEEGSSRTKRKKKVVGRCSPQKKRKRRALRAKRERCCTGRKKRGRSAFAGEDLYSGNFRWKERAEGKATPKDQIEGGGLVRKMEGWCKS